ncbi:MAG: hypothetical protein JWN52_2340 [Actinomycetia bacterium]|nr:hypothetical protein [Actinomycetes bacterium]
MIARTTTVANSCMTDNAMGCGVTRSPSSHPHDPRYTPWPIPNWRVIIIRRPGIPIATVQPSVWLPVLESNP